jgi:hypothetical protein
VTKSQKRKGSAAGQSKPFSLSKTIDIEAGVRIWKKSCIFGSSQDDAISGVSTLNVFGSTTAPQIGNKLQKDDARIKPSVSSTISVLNNTAGSRRVHGTLIIPPTLDEAVGILGQAPSGGLAGGLGKQARRTIQE